MPSGRPAGQHGLRDGRQQRHLQLVALAAALQHHVHNAHIARFTAAAVENLIRSSTHPPAVADLAALITPLLATLQHHHRTDASVVTHSCRALIFVLTRGGAPVWGSAWRLGLLPTTVAALQAHAAQLDVAQVMLSLMGVMANVTDLLPVVVDSRVRARLLDATRLTLRHHAADTSMVIASTTVLRTFGARREGAARLSRGDRALVDLLREHAHSAVVVNSACATLGLAPAATRRDVTWFLQQDGLTPLLRTLALHQRRLAALRGGGARWLRSSLRARPTRRGTRRPVAVGRGDAAERVRGIRCSSGATGGL